MIVTVPEAIDHLELTSTRRYGKVIDLIHQVTDLIEARVGVRSKQVETESVVASADSKWLVRDPLAVFDNGTGGDLVVTRPNPTVADINATETVMLSRLTALWSDTSTGAERSDDAFEFTVKKAYSVGTRKHIGFEVTPKADWRTHNTNLADVMKLQYVTGYTIDTVPFRWKLTALHMIKEWFTYTAGGPMRGDMDGLPAFIRAMLDSITPRAFTGHMGIEYYAA